MEEKTLSIFSILLIVSAVAIICSFSYEFFLTEPSPVRGLFTIVFFLLPFGLIGSVSSIIIIYEIYVQKFKTNTPLTPLNKLAFGLSIIFLVIILYSLVDVLDFGA